MTLIAISAKRYANGRHTDFYVCSAFRLGNGGVRLPG